MKTIFQNDGERQPALQRTMERGKFKPTEVTSEELHRRLKSRYRQLEVRHDKVSHAA